MTQRDLFERIEAMAEKSREKQASVPAPALDPSLPPNVVRLPVWPEAVRGVPNGVLRSALFGAIRRGPRAYIQAKPMASVEGVTVIFTGPRLDQADLDVWEQCLQLAGQQGLGCRIQFSASGFLKATGRNASGANHEWLKNAFRRLMSSVVEIKEGRRAYAGPLLHHWARDDETGQQVIELNPEIVRLYGPGGWTQVEWDERLALKGHPLAQWLHGFYSTHAEAFPVKVETLHRLCGSEAEQMKDFRKELREAFEQLAQAAGWVWRIDEHDLVQVERHPSRSQQKHLAKKPKKPRPTEP
jgi:hypothetical protein